MSKTAAHRALAPVSWIWAFPAPSGANVFCGFRRTFSIIRPRACSLQISADSRYWLYVNGRRIGHGPPRGWPDYWTLDSYDLSPHLNVGQNVIAVLVNHWTNGNFQYRPAPPGLTARLFQGRTMLWETDEHWRVRVAPDERTRVPRVSVQEAFEEQHDAMGDDGWRQPGYDDRDWAAATVVPSPHPRLVPRRIPFLGGETVTPQRLLTAEQVRPCEAVWSLSVKPNFAPRDRSSNFCFVRGYILTQVHSKVAQQVELIRPHHHSVAFWVNGEQMPPLTLPGDRDVVPEKARLKAGWNVLLFPYPGYDDALASELPAGGVHLPVFVVAVRARQPLRWACRGASGGSPWAFLGPFPLSAQQRARMLTHADWPRVVQAESIAPEATEELARAIPEFTLREWSQQGSAAWFQELEAEQIAEADVFAASCGDAPAGAARIVDPGHLFPTISPEPLIVYPPSETGKDVRLLFDFGQMLVGYSAFTVDAPEGTLLDLTGFEFIQPDGRFNLATGMNNSLRYRCRAGVQSFQSLQRRGFRYVWLTIRQLRAPLKIFRFVCEVATAPQAGLGQFQCSDPMLNLIWKTGAHTLRMCAEDTYTDCPTYEQTHWVGDARNEALVDWVANGDPRLWRHCLEQAGRGLKLLPLVPSHVPSAWENVLPAWSFLWMRSCREYLLWTGDRVGAGRLLPWVARNIEGIRRHLTEDGLFQIHAWNMFDWAPMDTPTDGIVTHQNCLAVAALQDAAELATLLNRPALARRWRQMAVDLSAAINQQLWDPVRGAYIDCIHSDGRRSDILSQQTQTAALISNVARGQRAEHCRKLVRHCPKDFVKAGSPFFEFFVLELLDREHDALGLLELIRRDWGFMIDQGATTFWELWTLSKDRLTRSHCHGWSSAPTFFLSTAILGIQPHPRLRSTLVFRPMPGKLRWMRGTVPTALGVVSIEGSRRGSNWHYRLEVPRGCRVIRRVSDAVVEVIRSTRQARTPVGFASPTINAYANRLGDLEEGDES